MSYRRSQRDKLKSVACSRTDDQISAEIAGCSPTSPAQTNYVGVKGCLNSRLFVKALFDLVDSGLKLNMISVKPDLIT